MCFQKQEGLKSQQKLKSDGRNMEVNRGCGKKLFSGLFIIISLFTILLYLVFYNSLHPTILGFRPPIVTLILYI
jgi:hypothetical protein